MRNFSQNLLYVQEHYQKKSLKKTDSATKSVDALQALVAITNAVQIECEGYAILGEYEPCKVCLEEFKGFIIDNRLNKRDTLVMLNESHPIDKKDIVNQFVYISKKIASFDASSQIENHIHDLLSVNKENGGDSNE